MLTNRSNQYNEYNNDKLPRRTALITQQKYMQSVKTKYDMQVSMGRNSSYTRALSIPRCYNLKIQTEMTNAYKN